MNGHVKRTMLTVALAALVGGGTAWAGDLTVDNLLVNQEATMKSNVVVWGNIVIPDFGPIPTNGLKLHYTFDSDSGGQVIDASGNGNNGYLAGGVAYEAGKSGLSARFTSPSTHIVCDSAALNMQGVTNMSVSLWIMPRYLTTYGTVIARGGYTSSSVCAGFFVRAPGYSSYPGIESYVYTNSGAVMTTAYAPRTQINRWYHIALTYNGMTFKMYVDGVLSSTSTAPSVRPVYDVAGTKMVIGNCAAVPYMGWSDQYFNGQIDEVRIYDRALGDAEVTRLMNFTATGGSGQFDGVGRFPKGIGYLAPLGDLSMGAYTNKP